MKVDKNVTPPFVFIFQYFPSPSPLIKKPKIKTVT